MAASSSSPGLPLRAVFTAGGCLARLDAGDVSLIQYPATELEPGPASVYLRLAHDVATEEADVGPVGRYDVHPLTGPASGSRVAVGPDEMIATGRWRGMSYTLTWENSCTHAACAWRVRIVNDSERPRTCHLMGTLDAALTPWAALRRSEYYVSQYLDCTPVETNRYGVTVAVRQNMPGATAPWLAYGSLRRGIGWATDLRQLTNVGEHRGRNADPQRWPGLRWDLPNTRLQQEHTLVAVQDAAVTLTPGADWSGGFFCWYVPDHPDATGPDDASAVEALLPLALADTADQRAEPYAGTALPVVPTLFSPGAIADGEPPTEHHLRTWVPGERRHVERPAGTETTPWAFQVDGDGGTPVHVVTLAKEVVVQRPHGHLLRSPAGLTPVPNAAVSTCWMRGGFHTHVCQGHASIDAVVTLRRGYLGVGHAHGVLVFVDTGNTGNTGDTGDSRDSGQTGDSWRLLSLPSAWAVEAGRCRWWYHLDDTTLRVTATADPDRPEFGLTVTTLEGQPCRLLVATELTPELQPPTPDRSPAPAGVVRVGVAPGEPLAARYPGGSIELSWAADVPVTAGTDELLFADGQSRGLRWLCLLTEPASRFELAVRPDLAAPPDTDPDEGPVRLGLPRLQAAPSAPQSLSGQVGALTDAVAWLAGDALVHYLTPRGLEQYTGGAWGTRDVCQGPVGLLLATDRLADLRALLLTVFASQQEDGSWAQWFNFQPAHRGPGIAPCHGDVPYWPLLALGEYLAASGDAGILERPLPFIGPDRIVGAESLHAHVERALGYLDAHATADRRLPAYGHGDWNDALQPADPALAARLSSTWTTMLAIHAFGTLADALTALPGSPAGALATRLSVSAAATRSGLREVMLADGELAGYVLLDDAGSCVERLVHPEDRRTGLRHGLLPAIHAIAYDLLTPAEAHAHLAMIRDHLHGPDGAHLFDRPARYAGGPANVFRRAEAASFWGREIGLMYTHAHLRYVEALARVGASAEAFTELMRVIPVGLTDRVPAAAPRQSTCYASSSDAAFTDRYDAQRHYPRALAGDVPLEAGWRVYSSGPGLTIRLVTETLLGWRRRAEGFDLDPCLPPELNGLTTTVPALGPDHVVRYHVGPTGVGVRRVTLDGGELPTQPLDNPYRSPGVRLRHADLRTLAPRTKPDGARRVLVVELG